MEDIYVEYFNLVYRYLYCLTQNSDLAEELTQDTFLKQLLIFILLKINLKFLPGYVKLQKIFGLTNCVKKKKISDTTQDIFDLINIEESIENNFILDEEHKELHNKIDTLDNKTKQVIYLHIYNDLTFKEIGNMLRKI